MSHPNPLHDRENERIEDSKFAPRRGENAHDERHKGAQIRAEFNPKRKGVVLAKRFGNVKGKVLESMADKAVKHLKNKKNREEYNEVYQEHHMK